MPADEDLRERMVKLEGQLGCATEKDAQGRSISTRMFLAEHRLETLELTARDIKEATAKMRVTMIAAAATLVVGLIIPSIVAAVKLFGGK